jgi:adenine deaminase
MPLPIGGLITESATKHAVQEFQKLHHSLHTIHPTLDYHLMLTLSFLNLPVIPSLKLTDSGLFDVKLLKHIRIEYEEKADH